MQFFFSFLKFDAEHTGHDKVAYLLIIKSALVAQTHKKLYSSVEMQMYVNCWKERMPDRVELA